MAACQKAGLIALYSHDGKPYLQMMKTKWKARSEPKYPLPAIANNCAQLQTIARLDVDVVVDEDVVHPPADVPDLFEGIDQQVVKDFKALRKAKKAAITKTALDGIRREAGKAGLSLEGALRACCERGWTGFKAEWVTGTSGGTPQPTRHREML
jgi:hypothetical protein